MVGLSLAFFLLSAFLRFSFSTTIRVSVAANITKRRCVNRCGGFYPPSVLTESPVGGDVPRTPRGEPTWLGPRPRDQLTEQDQTEPVSPKGGPCDAGRT